MRNRCPAGRTDARVRTKRPRAHRAGAWGGLLFRGGALALLCLLAMPPAGAWLRMRPNWATVVDDAEVIAVGHIVGTPVYVAHKRAPDQGNSCEFHARLAIDEVLKGQCRDKEIPVILQYGLSPSEYTQDGKSVQHKWPGEAPGLAIRDTGSSAMDFRPLLADARAPAVWLLAHYADRVGRNGSPTEDLSVQDPVHLQPIGMLPFFRSILKPDPIEAQLAFLHDPDPATRAKVLQYFTARRESKAFPAVADLLTDQNDNVVYDAIEACVMLGGKDALPQLRALLTTGRRDVFWQATHALGQLHDTGAVPQLTKTLATDARAQWRASAAGALGRIGDPAAIPALIHALKDDGLKDPGNGTEVWVAAREGLRSLTKSRLSPNGDRAACWWAAAQGMKPAVWEHFGVADMIAGMTVMGPRALEDTQVELFSRSPSSRSESLIYAARFGRTYDPVQIRDFWARWLAQQTWLDYLGLPSQADDELSVKIELTEALGAGQPVRLRYVLTNRGKPPLWLTKQWRESLEVRGVSGNGYSGGEGTSPGRHPSSAADFMRLDPGAQQVIVGKAIIWNDPHNMQHDPPRHVAAALCFDHRGTSFGLDAWVGEVWSEPIIIPQTAAPHR